MSGTGTPTLAAFNEMDPARAAELMGACLDITEWVGRVCRGRPYPDLACLHDAGAAAAAAITWDQCAGALDRHPRIGEKRAAVAGTSTESAWSLGEQSGVAAEQAQALRLGNEEYESRFGYIFLICAAGLPGDEILRALHRRMDHDHPTEQAEVQRELAKIALLRLGKAVQA